MPGNWELSEESLFIISFMFGATSVFINIVFFMVHFLKHIAYHIATAINLIFC